MTDSPPINAPRRAPPQDADIEQSGAPWSFHQKIDFRVKTIYFAFLVAMYFGLAQAYTEFWQPLFAYSGFVQSYVPEREMDSLIVLFVAAALTPTGFRRPSDIYVSLSILTTLVPTAVMYAYGDMGAETAYLTYVGLALIYLSRNIPIPIPDLRWGGNLIVIQLITLLSIIGVMLTAHGMGFSDFSFSLFNVYDRREIAFERLTGVVGYMVSFGLAANLLAIILSVFSKSWAMLAINLVASVFYFGLIGNKGPLFILPVLIILNYALYRQYIIVYLFFMTATIITAFTFCFQDQVLLVDGGNSSDLFDFASVLERRTLILPVWVNDAYIKYFSDTKVYWAYSRLSLGLVQQTLSYEPATEIGNYLRGSEMHANTGFVGSGYMNAGFIGVAIYAVVIGLCCRIIDVFAQRRDSKVLSTLICLPGFISAVTSSELPTVLFSHAWAAAILLVAIFRPKRGRGDS